MEIRSRRNIPDHTDTHTHTQTQTHTRKGALTHGYGIFNARSYSTSFCTLHAPLPHAPPTFPAPPWAAGCNFRARCAKNFSSSKQQKWEQHKKRSWNFYRLIHPDTFHAPNFSCSFSCPEFLLLCFFILFLIIWHIKKTFHPKRGKQSKAEIT